MKTNKKRIIVLFCLSLLLFSAVPAFGAIPEPSSSFYVADGADVISPRTETYIVEKNGQLESLCGGQIVVVTVTSLDGMNIEDYGYEIFNDWKIGDGDANNGVLLLLAIGEENYWCMTGRGLENQLTSGKISDILWDYLEPDFAAGDYDAGVRSTFDVLYNTVSEIYENGGAYSSASASDIISVIVTVIFLIIILAIAIIISVFRRRRRAASDASHLSYGLSLRRGAFRSRSSIGGISSPPPSSSGSSRPARSSRPSRRGGGGSSRGGGAGRRRR